MKSPYGAASQIHKNNEETQPSHDVNEERGMTEPGEKVIP